MSLSVDDIPAKVIPRRRSIKFDRAELAYALRAQCRAEGIFISEYCKLSVTGLAVNNYKGDNVSLVIDGD